MTMSNDEITRAYLQSKDQRKQIGILADLNGCDKEKIRTILIHHGVKLPTPGRPKKEIKEAQEKIEKKREAAVKIEKRKASEVLPIPMETPEVVRETLIKKTAPLPLSVIMALQKRIDEIEIEKKELTVEQEEIINFLEGSNE